MKKAGIHYKLIFIALLPLGIALNALSASSHILTERIYSTAVYRVLSQGLSLTTGVFPFSFAELLVVSLLLFFIYRLIVLVITLIKGRSGRWSILMNAAVNGLAFLGILYFTFVMVWGFNYNRLTVANMFDLEVRPSSTEELENVCKILIRETNGLRSQLREDQEGVMLLKGGYWDAFRRAPLGYKAASQTHPQLQGRYGNPKPVIFSAFMSYNGIWGIYMPFTAEANVNITVPDPFLPSTACHEMAHQRGFAREDEANYISYVTCKAHPDLDFQYSGRLLVLVSCLNSLYSYDPEGYKDIRSELGEGVRRDLAAVDRFNEKYESRLQEVSRKTNDLYLKANRQEEGERSYGRVVDLLLAEYREKK